MENKEVPSLPVETREQTATQIGNGYAHSKIILMGEHAVVYDFPAIALPFPAVQVHAEVMATKHQVHQLDCQYFVGDLSQVPGMLDNIKKAVEMTLESFKLAPDPMLIKITSTIPQERGMGSSAAVSVAIVRAICDFHQMPLEDYQLHMIVNQAEVIAHESTSGLDTLVTSTSSPVIYRKSQAPRPFKLKLDAYLIVADSGQAGQTKKAVNHVHQLKEKKPEFVQQMMAAIGNFVQESHDAILAQNPELLGRLMTYNHYYLNQLGVSNPFLDRIINAAWLEGALGAKMTGGGLGGCVIALTRDKESAKAVAQAMQAAGAIQTWYLHLG